MPKTVAVLSACLILGFSAVNVHAQSQAPNAQPAATWQPITPQQRGLWLVQSIVGAQLAGEVVSSAWSTAFNNPHEYGPTWKGFGKRYGVGIAGIAIGNTIEAGVGSLWGEDPRYFRSPSGTPFGKRVKQVIKFSFDTHYEDGSVHFAYARLTGNVSNNFISNIYRPPSENDWQHALVRVGEGYLGKMAGNAFREFWPDVRKRMSHKKD